jgi:hypothetical protein
MPERIAYRVVPAALLLMLTIVGIGAAGPTVGMHTPSRDVVLVTGAALEVVLAALVVALRWRAAPAVGVGGRLRPLLSGALIVGLIAVPVAVIIGTTEKIRPRRLAGRRGHGGVGRPVRLRGARVTHGRADLALAHDVLIGLLVAAVLVAAILIWRHRHLVRLRQRDHLIDTETGTPADPALAARAIEVGRQAMRDLDDARAAIIACYLAMEESLAEAGAAREAAETPDELLARAAGLVNAAAAATLTALFYEARFSTHPMPAARRDAAERALADLAATLPAPATEPAVSVPAMGTEDDG